MKRFLKIVFCASLLFNFQFSILNSLQAQCTVKGVLFDEKDGEAVPFANVVLYQGEQQTNHSCATDINGFFLINRVPEGDYTLKVRYMGYEEYASPVVLKKNLDVRELLDNVCAATEPAAKEKPDCELIGQDGNIFNLMGIAARTLRQNGMASEAQEMTSRITSQAGSYDEALGIIGEYVNITGPDEVLCEDADQPMEWHE